MGKDIRTFGVSIAIKHLFMNGYTDEKVISEYDAIDGIYDGGWDCENSITDVRDLLFQSQDYPQVIGKAIH